MFMNLKRQPQMNSLLLTRSELRLHKEAQPGSGLRGNKMTDNRVERKFCL